MPNKIEKGKKLGKMPNKICEKGQKKIWKMCQTKFVKNAKKQMNFLQSTFPRKFENSDLKSN